MGYNGQGRILLLNDGLCDDSWDVSTLRCIVRGISPTVMANPPPQEIGAAFRFISDADCANGVDEENNDLHLCMVFDSPEIALYATKAFSDMCNVPIQYG
jgi:hypothetical protein